MLRLAAADRDLEDRPRERWAEGEELARVELAELSPALLCEAELVSGALQVHVEPRPADQLVVGLGRGILVELREPLRGEDRAEPALSPAGREVEHGARALRVALLRAVDVHLVDDDQCGVPEPLRGVDQGIEEEAHEADAVVVLELVDVEDGRGAELEEPLGQECRRSRLGERIAATGRGEDVIVALAEGRELALGIEDQVLHLSVRLLEEAAEQMALAPAAVGLHEQARVDEAVEITADGASLVVAD